MEVLIYIVMVVLTVIPMIKLLPSYDIAPYWAVVVVIPLGLIVLLWVMASRLDRTRPGGRGGL